MWIFFTELGNKEIFSSFASMIFAFIRSSMLILLPESFITVCGNRAVCTVLIYMICFKMVPGLNLELNTGNTDNFYDFFLSEIN